MNEALISGNLDFASGGVGPLVTTWARTKDNLKVKGIAALNSMPLWLNSINPSVKMLKDFTDKDRIALPAFRVSIQAVILQMAAEKELGAGKGKRMWGGPTAQGRAVDRRIEPSRRTGPDDER